MLRSELVRSIDNLQVLLEPLAHHLRATLKTRSDQSKAAFDRAGILDVYFAFREAEKKFGAAEKQIIEIFKLDWLTDPAFWTALLTQQGPGELPSGMFRQVEFATEYLPQFATLLHRDFQSPSTSEETDPARIDASILTLMLSEDDERVSSPKRITDAVSGVDQVYNALAVLDGKDGGTLAVVGCDSGSDKSFDFLGNAELMKEFKQFFLSMWDRVVFHRTLDFAERVKCVSETLPVLDRIRAMEDSGALQPESAELLRRKLTDGAVKLLQSGVTIPEVRSVAYQEPTSLLTAAPTLLLGGPTRSDDGRSAIGSDSAARRRPKITPHRGRGLASSTPHMNDLDGLTDEEQAQLDKLLKKQSKNGRSRPGNVS